MMPTTNTGDVEYAARFFRGSSQDLCQVFLRCNIDYQYHTRTFLEVETNTQPTLSVASEHTSERLQE